MRRVPDGESGHRPTGAPLVPAASDGGRFALRIPADPTRLSALRRRLDDFFLGHEVGETDRFDLTVAVSEAAANAIEHPVRPVEPAITVEVSIAGGEVVVMVRDTGQWREAGDVGFRGRGLALIGALGELTVIRTPAGTTVRLRRQLQS
jgi:anti-sigma regulatory factor (Ser/Thr protein kinase)